MEEKIITIFCLVDDLLEIIGLKDDKRAKICNCLRDILGISI